MEIQPVGMQQRWNVVRLDRFFQGTRVITPVSLRSRNDGRFPSKNASPRTGTGVEQAVVYSTSTTGLSTLTFRGEVVAGGGGVEKRSEVMYCIEEDMYIYYRDITCHSYTA